jgi:RNA polymerase sigma-70 factor, ECF subfamily
MNTPLSLIERIRDPSDAASWRRLVDLYSPLIRRWLRREVAGPDEDDIVQEVLAAVLRAMPTFEHSGRPGAFRHWLRTTTAHHLSTFCRARRTRAAGASPAVWDLLENPESDPSHAWDREHDEFVVRRLLDLMEPEFTTTTWQAFRRQVIDGLRPAEVAAELDTSVNAVLIAKSRVLARLRQEGRGLLD